MLRACKGRLVRPIYFDRIFSFSSPLTLLFQMLVSLSMDSLPGEWLGYLDNHLLNSFFSPFPIMIFGTWPTTMQQASNRLRKKSCAGLLVNYCSLDAGGIPQLPSLVESF